MRTPVYVEFALKKTKEYGRPHNDRPAFQNFISSRFEKNPKLTGTYFNLIDSGEADIWVSLASIWEIAIKIKLDKLTMISPLPDFLALIWNLGFQKLPIEVRAYLGNHKFTLSSQ